ncbi:hypothetical protein AB0C89_06030 [Streptomyces sp. NPDC048491]|uniref:hypothetical protein n=1 Tax=Streptomyces sp. NPDC048491 TaxID=3157207 RepID=UPI0034245925
MDRRAVVVLLCCQALSGFFEAFGLLATIRTITALIASGDFAHRLRDASASTGGP